MSSSTDKVRGAPYLDVVRQLHSAVFSLVSQVYAIQMLLTKSNIISHATHQKQKVCPVIVGLCVLTLYTIFMSPYLTSDQVCNVYTLAFYIELTL